MTIYLVRHTEYYNPSHLYAFHLPMYLTEAGREHARRIGEWFSKETDNLPITSSPMVRTVQTAEIIASKTNGYVIVDHRLEETGCSRLEGTKQPEIDPWKYEVDDSSRETKDAVLKRVRSIYDEKVAEGKDCIIVSHGDAITFLYDYLTKRKEPQYIWDPALGNFPIQRGEIVKIEMDSAKLLRVERITV
jgi:broad specificity phosphatase PhoE